MSIRIGMNGVVVAGLIVVSAGAAFGERLSAERIDRELHGKSTAERHKREFPCVLGSGALNSPLPGAGRTYQDLLKGVPSTTGVDTIRVALFRVEWEEDSAGDLTTAEGGRFLREPDPEWPNEVDAPPHDSTYFHTHMQVLRTYMAKQSYGHAHVEWEMFPRSLDGAYQLGDTGDHLPDGNPDTWDLIERSDLLVELCQDIIVHVDTIDDAVDFSDFDGYLVFHAGPDLQTDINRDSPGDIPSFFLSLGDSDVVHVDMEDDNFAVRSMTMVPEYNSQDEFIFGLNGVLAHEFGHQLGLPDLYNVETFWPAVGQWDLMDSGGLVSIDAGDVFLTGTIPTSFSAWSKLWLGWIEPEIITGPDAIAVACATMAEAPPGTNRYAMIPLNGQEYFLIENRCGLAGDDGFAAKLDSVNSVMLGPVTNNDDETPTYDYDFPLPGWGILIWHINERNLNPFRIAFNNVNIDYNDRGLELEEADGIKDLGNPFSAYWDGSQYDPYFAENNDRFGPETAPNSDLADGAESFVDISMIGDADSVMTMQVDIRRSIPGFPVPMNDSTIIEPAGLILRNGGRISAFWVSLDSLGGLNGGLTCIEEQGADSVVAVSAFLPSPPVSFAVAGNFDSAMEGQEVVVLIDGFIILEGGAELFTVLGPAMTDSLAADPIAVDVDGDGVDEMVVATSRTITAYGLSEDTAIAKYQISLPSPVSSNLAALESGSEEDVICVAEDGRYYAAGLPDVASGVGDFPPYLLADPGTEGFTWVLTADLERDGNVQTVLASVGGIIHLVNRAGESVDGWPVHLDEPVTGEPYFTDVNGDGYPEIAIPSGMKIVLLERNGVAVSDSPLRIPAYFDRGVTLVGNGISGSTGDEPLFEPIAGDGGGRIWSWDRSDEVRDDWPVSTGTWNTILVAGGTLGGEGSSVYALSRDGMLYAFPVGGSREAEFLWSAPGGGAGLTYGLDTSKLAGGEAPGDPPGSIHSAYCYPNPSNGGTTKLRFEMSAEANATVKIIDVAGHEVLEIESSARFGPNEVEIDTSDLASGLYYIRLEAGSDVRLVKMAVLR